MIDYYIIEYTALHTQSNSTILHSHYLGYVKFIFVSQGKGRGNDRAPRGLEIGKNNPPNFGEK